MQIKFLLCKLHRVNVQNLYEKIISYTLCSYSANLKIDNKFLDSEIYQHTPTINNWNQHIESIPCFAIHYHHNIVGIDIRNSIVQFMVIACGPNISDIDVSVC